MIDSYTSIVMLHQNRVSRVFSVEGHIDRDHIVHYLLRLDTLGSGVRMVFTHINVKDEMGSQVGQPQEYIRYTNTWEKTS